MTQRPTALIVPRKQSSWKSHYLTPFIFQGLQESIIYKGISESFQCKKFQGLSAMLLKTNSMYSACASDSHLVKPCIGVPPIILSAQHHSKEKKEPCVLPCLSLVFLGHHCLTVLIWGFITITPSSIIK